VWRSGMKKAASEPGDTGPSPASSRLNAGPITTVRIILQSIPRVYTFASLQRRVWVPEFAGTTGGVCVPRLAKHFQSKISNSPRFRSRAAARVGLLVFLPLRGDGAAKDAPLGQ